MAELLLIVQYSLYFSVSKIINKDLEQRKFLLEDHFMTKQPFGFLNQ